MTARAVMASPLYRTPSSHVKPFYYSGSWASVYRRDYPPPRAGAGARCCHVACGRHASNRVLRLCPVHDAELWAKARSLTVRRPIVHQSGPVQRRPVGRERLEAFCWCERTQLLVPADLLARGITATCGHPSCDEIASRQLSTV